MNSSPRSTIRHTHIVFLMAASALFMPTAEAAFKCQAADGKIEYSDRPCETNKNTLDKPRASTGVQSRPIGNPMDQLNKLFADYEARLCDREILGIELEAARFSGAIAKQPANWKVKQDRQIELNETLVDFQIRAGKITKAAGNDSQETAALRKFQLGLKDCGHPKTAPATPAVPAAPTPAPPATPAAKPAK